MDPYRNHNECHFRKHTIINDTMKIVSQFNCVGAHTHTFKVCPDHKHKARPFITEHVNTKYALHAIPEGRD